MVSFMNRRQAILKFCQFVAASPLLKADRKYSDLADPLLTHANVFDFAKLAKAKLDPLALPHQRREYDRYYGNAVRKEIDPTDLSFDNGWQELLYSQWRTGNRSG